MISFNLIRAPYIEYVTDYTILVMIYLILFLVLSSLFLAYTIHFAWTVRRNIGLFASLIDVESFVHKYKAKLQINTTCKQIIYGQKYSKYSTGTICLFYNEVQLIFYPVIVNRIHSIDRNEYRDYFYESLAYLTGREKVIIIRDVKWYFIKNFFRMRSFYQILFNMRPFKPILPFVPQNILLDPDRVLSYVPNQMRINTKLTLVEIDSFTQFQIRALYTQSHNSTDKRTRVLNNLMRIAKRSKHKIKLSRSERNILDPTFSSSLQQSILPVALIEAEIQRTREFSHHLGSVRIGKCNLHALDHKLTPLFAADLHKRFAKSNTNIPRSTNRIILCYHKTGQLSYYTTLYQHQYKVLKFARKLGHLEDEMIVLSCFNKAKCELNHGYNKIDSFIRLIQIRWTMLCRDSQVFLVNNQSYIESLLQE